MIANTLKKDQTSSRPERTHRRSAPASAAATRASGAPADVEERARELIIMAAHDLCSPLAAIKLRVAAVAWRRQTDEEPTSAEWASAVHAMRRAADEACGLIEDLLAVERLAQHTGPAPAVSTDIMEVIHEAIGQQREALIHARSRVRVLKKKGIDRPRGPWDRGYLLRVFGNLLRNAAIHAPGAPIDIVLARKGNVLGIVFSDAGPGLPSPMKCEELASFRRASTLGASHGLGHWIVHRALERLGGHLRVRTSPGQGVAFDIELPDLVDQHQRGDAQARARERREPTPCHKVSVRLQRCA